MRAGKEKEEKQAAAPPADAAEEAAYLEAFEQPADPWVKERSPYGGALTAAECYDKLCKVWV